MERGQAPKILRLAPDSMLVPSLCPFSAYTLSILFLFLSFIISLGLQGSACASLAHYRCASRTLHTWGLLSQKLKLFIWASCPTHVLYFRMYLFSPLYASIWLKFWPSWVAWLLYLCPTFLLIRLGHKGSTSTIVTAGSSGCAPQTGWSRKLAFLREYSVRELKMSFTFHNTKPQMFSYTTLSTVVRTCTLMHAYPGKGTLNGTILSGRCFLLPM